MSEHFSGRAALRPCAVWSGSHSSSIVSVVRASDADAPPACETPDSGRPAIFRAVADAPPWVRRCPHVSRREEDGCVNTGSEQGLRCEKPGALIEERGPVGGCGCAAWSGQHHEAMLLSGPRAGGTSTFLAGIAAAFDRRGGAAAAEGLVRHRRCPTQRSSTCCGTWWRNGPISVAADRFPICIGRSVAQPAAHQPPTQPGWESARLGKAIRRGAAVAPRAEFRR